MIGPGVLAPFAAFRSSQLVLSALLLANAGLPMLAVYLPSLMLALLPVVFVEWLVAERLFAFDRPRAFRDVLLANLFSSLLGIPLLWFLGLALLLIFGPLLPRAEGGALGVVRDAFHFAQTMIWAGGTGPGTRLAGAAMLVPAFFVSLYAEYWLLRRLWPDLPPERLRKFVRVAHLGSYAIIVVCWLAALGVMQ